MYNDLTRKSLPHVQQACPCCNTITAPSPRPQHSINKDTNISADSFLSLSFSAAALYAYYKKSLCLLAWHLTESTTVLVAKCCS